MLLTDTHCHFYLSPADVTAAIDRAQVAGVTRLLAVGGSDELNAGASAAAVAHPSAVRLALGLDRDQTRDLDARLETFEHLIARHDLAAIGEAGLDYHHRPDTRQDQQRLFTSMLRLAAARRLPVIVHTREADADTLAAIDAAASCELAAAGRAGVVHCFTGDRSFAGQMLDRGFYISFSGIVTFRNADALRAVAAYVPSDRILIETDSPFLTPVPRRGEKNEPAFLTHVARCVAKARGVAVEELAAQTTANAERLFGPWGRHPLCGPEPVSPLAGCPLDLRKSDL